MATHDELNQLLRDKQAAEDFFAARALAQNVYFTMAEALAKGQEIAQYYQNPLIPGGAADELRVIMGKAQTFFGDLDTNHHTLLNWAPGQAEDSPTEPTEPTE
jgi:hypothetical protein